jgi:hypothetical protein
MPDAPVTMHPDANMGGPPDASTGDGNDSFAQAVALTVGDTTGAHGAIDMPGDRDFYKFTATAGQYIALRISANTMDNPMLVDTVIQLYDSTMTKVAENDDAIPRVNTDSEIIIKIPATGEYFVEVMEWSDWTSTPPLKGGSTFIYTLTAMQLMGGTGGVVDEGAGDPDTSPATALAGGSPAAGTFGVGLGMFSGPTDQDYVSFTVGATGKYALAAVVPPGATGYGSTATAVGEILDSTGANVIARQQMNPGGMQPPLTSGQYLLHVTTSTAAAGANDFWVGKFAIGTTDNTAETEGATATGVNDTTATAQAVTLAVNGTSHAGYILSHLPAGDVDMFSFSVAAGAMVNLYCGSLQEGSGVQGMKAELVNSGGTTVASGVEDPMNGATVMATPAAGTYYLKLSKTGQDPVVTGDWVRCAIVTMP